MWLCRNFKLSASYLLLCIVSINAAYIERYDKNLSISYEGYINAIGTTTKATDGCSIPFDKNFPILLRTDVDLTRANFIHEVIYMPIPDANNANRVILENDVEVHIVCPDTNGNLNTATMRVMCENNRLSISGNNVNENNLKCNSMPISQLNLEMFANNTPTIFTIGFKIILNNIEYFFKFIEGRFNELKLTTEYTHHFITRTSITLSYEGPSEFKYNFYPKLKDYYKKDYQRDHVLDKIKRANNLFDTTNNYLTKGHMTPRGDFALAYLREATYNYYNAIPQWNGNNNGKWNKLENDIRKKVTDYLEVYTGTIGILQINDCLRTNTAFITRFDESCDLVTSDDESSNNESTDESFEDNSSDDSDDNSWDDNLSDDNSSNDNSSEDNSSNDNSSEDNSFGDSASDDNSSDDDKSSNDSSSEGNFTRGYLHGQNLLYSKFLNHYKQFNLQRHSNGDELYLIDENEKLVPIPKLLWKVYVDRNRNEAIGYAMFNKPFITGYNFRISNECRKKIKEAISQITGITTNKIRVAVRKHQN